MRISVLLSLSFPIFSPAQVSTPSDLTKLDLEDLMNVQVTSVSKREEKISAAGAAIYVINQEDIRRSGATNIPDLLRMVPGVHVAQINGIVARSAVKPPLNPTPIRWTACTPA
jgi:outer membrane cobalamin receptor